MKKDLEKKILNEDVKIAAYAVKGCASLAKLIAIGLCANPLVPLCVSMLLPKQYRSLAWASLASPLCIIYMAESHNYNPFHDCENALKKRKELLEEYKQYCR